MKQDFCERRKHARLLLSLPMQVQWVNEEGTISKENCKSVNVSAGGVYYKSREEIPLDTNATVIFNLTLNGLANSRMLRIRGRVVRVEEGDMEKKGIALKFLEELKFSTSYNN